MVVVGPVAEEIMKVALAAIIVERRPYWFHSPAAIRLAVLASAMGFAVIENLLYLNVYIPNPTPTLVAWRWVVCTALHLGCTSVASEGVVRAWSASRQQFRRPDMAVLAPRIGLAAAIHGGYNLVVITLEMSGYHF